MHQMGETDMRAIGSVIAAIGFVAVALPAAAQEFQLEGPNGRRAYPGLRDRGGVH